MKYIRSINNTYPTANGKFIIEGGPGIHIDHIPNGLKIKNAGVRPGHALFYYETNNPQTMDITDCQFVRSSMPYFLKGAYLPLETTYYQWEDMIELVKVADDILQVDPADDGTIRFMKDGIVNIIAQGDSDISGAIAFNYEVNLNDMYNMQFRSNMYHLTDGNYRVMGQTTTAVNANDEIRVYVQPLSAEYTTQTLTNVKIYIEFEPIPET